MGQVVNLPQPGEIQGHLVPSTGVDTTPPTVRVVFPNSGQTLTANRATNVTWTAEDASGIAAISIYVSLNNGTSFQPIALGLPNTGSYSWFPANRPADNTARLRIVAIDNAGNTNQDQSDATFSIVSPPGGRVPTTLRDFDMPGTQPFEGGPPLDPPSGCASCHGNYNSAVEPYFNWRGSMMAHASRDLLFQANMTIANQDAPDSGDLCLRCHLPRGWLCGRSVPTDGAAMLPADNIGVTCDLCHRMVDPVYKAGTSPANDSNILAALSFRDTNSGNGMFVVDPSSFQRGPVQRSRHAAHLPRLAVPSLGGYLRHVPRCEQSGIPEGRAGQLRRQCFQHARRKFLAALHGSGGAHLQRMARQQLQYCRRCLRAPVRRQQTRRDGFHLPGLPHARGFGPGL